jgi:UDP-glucose 4-epimerase
MVLIQSDYSLSTFLTPDNMKSYSVSGASLSSVSLNSSSAATSPEPSLIGEPVSFITNPHNLFPTENKGEIVLVVGGLGYIGSHTTLELLKEGFNVIVVDNLSNSYESTLSCICKLALDYCGSTGRSLPWLKLHKIDYRSPSMRLVLESYSTSTLSNSSSSLSLDVVEPRQSRISGVIHFAAYKAAVDSIQTPLPYYQNNVCGFVDFLILLKEFSITNLVFSSSATVYGAKANEGRPLREEDLVHQPENTLDRNGTQDTTPPDANGLTSPYGRTKYFCEAILADVAHSDPSWKIVALRYFNPVGCHESGLLGEDPRQQPTNLFPVITRVLTGAKPYLEIFGSDWDTRDGTAVRDFIHVVDLARGHIAALSAVSNGSVQQSFRAYNLGTGKGSSVSEAIDSFEAALLQKIPVRHVGRRQGDVGSCIAATERVERELGWKTERTLFQCARDTWNYICKSNAKTGE